MRSSLVVAVAIAVAVPTGDAHAGERVSLDWAAPRECPSRAEIARRIATQLPVAERIAHRGGQGEAQERRGDQQRDRDEQATNDEPEHLLSPLQVIGIAPGPACAPAPER